MGPAVVRGERVPLRVGRRVLTFSPLLRGLRRVEQFTTMGGRADELVPILRVKSAETAAQWYSRLGFVLEGVHRFEPGMPAYAFLKRGPTTIHLSEHRGDAPRRGVVYWYVDRGMLEVFAAEFGVTIERQPWCDEVLLTDPDGNRLRIGCPNELDDPGFAPSFTSG